MKWIIRKNKVQIKKNPFQSYGFLKKLFMSEFFILILSIIMFMVVIPFQPSIVSLSALSNILSNILVLLMVCMGQTVVLIVAGIDLSMVGVIHLTGMVGGMIMAGSLNKDVLGGAPIWGIIISEKGGLLGGTPLAVPVGILLMLLVGILFGFLNGISIVKFKMPPVMVTLVSLMLSGALALYLTKSENINNLPESFTFLGSNILGYIPVSLFITGIFAVIIQLLLTRSILGRWFYATGTNIKTSIVSGVPTSKVTIMAYVFSGFCAALASVLYISRAGYSSPSYFSDSFLLDVIGATVIGGASLFGGKGTIVGTTFGVIFYVLLSKILNFININTDISDFIRGAVILGAVLLDISRTNLKNKSV